MCGSWEDSGGSTLFGCGAPGGVGSKAIDVVAPIFGFSSTGMGEGARVGVRDIGDILSVLRVHSIFPICHIGAHIFGDIWVGHRSDECVDQTGTRASIICFYSICPNLSRD